MRVQEQFRRAAIACLAQRVQVSLASAAQQASAETEQLLETQSELGQRGAHLQVAVRIGRPPVFSCQNQNPLIRSPAILTALRSL